MNLPLDTYNEAAQQWKNEMVETSKATATAMGVTHRAYSPSKSASVQKIRGRVGMKSGLVERITITFPRELIWTQKGAGKGMAGSKGSRWIDKYGKQKRTNPESLGKMNTGGRQAKPFMQEALDGPNGVDKLATIAAETIGAAITNNLFIS